MDDELFQSDEELVEEEDETTAAEEVEVKAERGEEEESDDGGEEEEETDVMAPAAKKRKRTRQDPGWLREIFLQVAKEPDYFCDGEKYLRARERILTALREKNIVETARHLNNYKHSWIWRNCNPPWMSEEERATLEQMRETAKLLKEECSERRRSIEWGQQLFLELKNIPEYFKMKNKRIANKKIVDALRKKNIIKTTVKVRQHLYNWIWRKLTPLWMTAEEKTALKEMRKVAERFERNCERKRNRSLTLVAVTNDRPSRWKRRVQRSPEASDDEADLEESTEEKEEVQNEPKKEEQKDVPQDDDDQVYDGVQFDREDEAYEDNGPAIDGFPVDAVQMEPMDVVLLPGDANSGIPSAIPASIEQKKTGKAPIPQEFRINPDQKEEETRTRAAMLLEFYDQIDWYKNRLSEEEKKILKLEQNARDVTSKFKEENEALKKKLSVLQKRPEEVLEKAGEVRERDVPEELKPLLELKGRVLGTANTYRIQQALGCGTFGLVFRVEHTETKEVSALKVVVDEEVMEEELRVMERMKQFEEKNEYICAPSDFFRGSHNGVDFIAFSMELLPIDLFSLFWNDEHKKKKFTSEPVLQILAQLFSALDFLSRHGIVYSDVKQENLMVKKFDVETRGDEDLVRNPVVRLIDFNTMREIGDSSLCQTAHFRAPEVILGLAFDARIDSWSAGILAVDLLEKDYFIDVDYPAEDKEMPYEHLGMISFVLNEPIPLAMWMASSLDQRRFPKEVEDQHTLAEVFEGMKHSLFNAALQQIVTQLLTIDPKDRPSPNKALSFLEDLLPH